VKYDDAFWHYGGDFPQDLPPEAGATHIAMFVAWAATAGLIGQIHSHELSELLASLLNRSVTPGAWFIAACDEKFTDEDLNEEGNAFAADYYLDPEPAKHTYLSDYARAFPESGDLYRVPDNWDSFERLRPLLDERLSEWRLSKAR
jgi:hypothetical protein